MMVLLRKETPFVAAFFYKFILNTSPTRGGLAKNFNLVYHMQYVNYLFFINS